MMTLTLTPEQERRIKTLAKRKRKPVETVLTELLAEEGLPEVEDHTLELFAKWDKEDTERLATMTPEEIAAEDARDEELLRSLKSSRLSLRVPSLQER